MTTKTAEQLYDERYEEACEACDVDTVNALATAMIEHGLQRLGVALHPLDVAAMVEEMDDEMVTSFAGAYATMREAIDQGNGATHLRLPGEDAP